MEAIPLRYLRQFLVILAFSFAGEALRALLPLPIPASVYGLALLLVCLCLGLVKVEQVKSAADFLLEIMPVLFIRSVVGLMDLWDVLRSVLLPAVVIAVASSFVVLAVTGHTAQWMLRRKGGGKDE